MFQLAPQMRILVAVEPIDGRMGIDRLAGYCRQHLEEDPFSGCIFIFRTRRATSVKLLAYDGRGYWLAQKRLSQGTFRLWPTGDARSCNLEPHQVQVLLAAGNPQVATAPIWRSVAPCREVPKPLT
ncbi:MAG: IS66 family insertion sequence element accessory protein TnpB [Fimbriimonadaceae bacterium]|nr:IS66 family insertion sequence element accessory protein TnpB [Fimbriimonadaceae bacterium]